MGRIIVLITVLLMALGVGIACAEDFGQVTCNSSSPVAIGTITPGVYKDFIIQNQTPTVGVYIGPNTSLTAVNGGILLSTATGIAVVFEGGASPWYCITSSSTATVGWIRR
jgi:hypothetical protein